MVIRRSPMPHTFKNACINKGNLPVIYGYNKKVSIISGI